MFPSVERWETGIEDASTQPSFSTGAAVHPGIFTTSHQDPAGSQISSSEATL